MPLPSSHTSPTETSGIRLPQVSSGSSMLLPHGVGGPMSPSGPLAPPPLQPSAPSIITARTVLRSAMPDLLQQLLRSIQTSAPGVRRTPTILSHTPPPALRRPDRSIAVPSTGTTSPVPVGPLSAWSIPVPGSIVDSNGFEPAKYSEYGTA